LGIKGLGDASAEEIRACRKEGPYRDFMDFLDRVDIKTVGKKVIELLIKTGAFDGFGISRAVLAENLERAVEYAQNRLEKYQFRQ
jgi:DNA polymerase-3 subunit alpha